MKHYKYDTGLVLSGGGARGLSHLGSVKALYELGYQFDIFIGTSIGAFVGCALADGFHPDELISLLTPDKLKSFVKTSIRTDGLMTLKGAESFLKKLLRHKNIEDLPTPFIAAATDLQKGVTTYFSKGNIIDAVVASASIPLVFPPRLINNVQYVDGSVLNNLPARYIREDCRKVIGLHVNPQNLGLYKGRVDGLSHMAERIFYLSMLGNVIPDKAMCDLFLEFESLSSYSIFEFSKMKELVDIGYSETLSVKKESF